MTIRSLLSISEREVSFARRGFPDDVPGVREHLERAGGAFVYGYNAALRHSATPALADALHALPRDLHGFAFEGASMALTLLDFLTPWARTRWRWLVAGDGAPHVYLCFVGAGWAMARLHVHHVPHWIAQVDPILAPLACDGYGFHQAFFHPQEYVRLQKAAGRNARDYDAGIGRSLWFVEGADPARIAATIARFPRQRQADLWSGAGLAFAYAGGASVEAARLLWDLAGGHRAELAQGVAFAAKARHRAGNVTAATELACNVAWNASAERVAEVVDGALEDARSGFPNDVFANWRRLLAGKNGVGKSSDAVSPLERPLSLSG
jgi:hypothetical protein